MYSWFFFVWFLSFLRFDQFCILPLWYIHDFTEILKIIIWWEASAPSPPTGPAPLDPACFWIEDPSLTGLRKRHITQKFLLDFSQVPSSLLNTKPKPIISEKIKNRTKNSGIQISDSEHCLSFEMPKNLVKNTWILWTKSLITQKIKIAFFFFR